MRALKECDPGELARIRVVLCDIDDTLTWRGRLGVNAYEALARLRDEGVVVLPITGRPAGWCDHIARMWPVDGVVGENGAFYFRYDDDARTMIRRYWRNAAERGADRNKLDELCLRILADVPGSAIASDQAYREADLAIDFCEDVPALPDAEVQRIVDIFESAGAVAKISSIHVNGWFGDYDKLSMTRLALTELFGIDIDAAPETIAFVGDSPNDSPMFGFFPLSVGVANVREFEGRLPAEPAWITTRPGGDGFAEFADLLLEARSKAGR